MSIHLDLPRSFIFYYYHHYYFCQLHNILECPRSLPLFDRSPLIAVLAPVFRCSRVSRGATTVFHAGKMDSCACRTGLGPNKGPGRGRRFCEAPPAAAPGAPCVRRAPAAPPAPRLCGPARPARPLPPAAPAAAEPPAPRRNRKAPGARGVRAAVFSVPGPRIQTE